MQHEQNHYTQSELGWNVAQAAVEAHDMCVKNGFNDNLSEMFDRITHSIANATGKSRDEIRPKLSGAFSAMMLARHDRDRDRELAASAALRKGLMCHDLNRLSDV